MVKIPYHPFLLVTGCPRLALGLYFFFSIIATILIFLPWQKIIINPLFQESLLILGTLILFLFIYCSFFVPTAYCSAGPGIVIRAEFKIFFDSQFNSLLHLITTSPLQTTVQYEFATLHSWLYTLPVEAFSPQEITWFAGKKAGLFREWANYQNMIGVPPSSFLWD